MSCLSKVPIFSQLTGEEKDEVHAFLRPARFKKGEHVAHANTKEHRLLVLNRGSAKIVRTSKDGREQILRTLKVGDYIGEMSVFNDQPSASDVIATEDSSFCMLDQAHLRELLASKPKLAFRLLADLSARLERVETYAESLGLTPASERLYTFFVEQAAGRKSFVLSDPKKDLAAHLGITPETLSRTLNKLESEKRISVSGKEITFLSER